jgi:hypothetical protein
MNFRQPSHLILLLLVLFTVACGPDPIDLDDGIHFIIEANTFPADVNQIILPELSAFECLDGFKCNSAHKTLIMIKHDNVSACGPDQYAVTSKSYQNRIIHVCDYFMSQLGMRYWLYTFFYMIKHEFVHSNGGQHIACDGYNIMCPNYDGAYLTEASQKKDWTLLRYTNADRVQLCARSTAAYCDGV